jgi:hypothetical protein
MASLVKELQLFMSEGKYGKKISIQEFRELTDQDKVDFREMLIGEGKQVDELKKKEE